jgi:hypothetical protein
MHRRRKSVSRLVGAVAVLSLATFAACRSAAGSDTELALRTETDSIGDTLVVRTIGSGDAGVRELVEEARIGETEGAEEYTFGSISEILALPDGSVLIFDRLVPALRHYGGDGRLIRTIGRKGAGPGEYEASGGLALLQDGRIAMWDPRNGRIQLYSQDGTAGEMIRLPSGFFSTRSVWTDASGRIYYRAVLRGNEETPRQRPSIRTGVGRLTLGESVHDTLPPPVEDPDDLLLSAHSPNDNSFGMRFVPFSAAPTWTVYDGGFAFTTDGRYRIVLQRDGRLMAIEREMESIPVQAAERANHEEVTTFDMRGINPGWSWNGPRIPDTKPFVRSLLPAPDGKLWVQTSAPGVIDSTLIEENRAEDKRPPLIWTERVTADVFASDGQFLGRVVFPERVHWWTLSAYGDHVWAVQTDEFGVEQLVRWRITPALGDHSATASAH